MRKEKVSGCKADIFFSCATNERIVMRSMTDSASARIRECPDDNESKRLQSCLLFLRLSSHMIIHI